MMRVGSLECVGCGAIVHPHEHRCTYCTRVPVDVSRIVSRIAGGLQAEIAPHPMHSTDPERRHASEAIHVDEVKIDVTCLQDEAPRFLYYTPNEARRLYRPEPPPSRFDGDN